MRASGRRTRRGPVLRAAQRGLLALVLLAVLIPAALYALLGSANTATSQVRAKRHEVTQQALRDAKHALVAWSALHANGPGHLLCPDLDDDGEANTIACGTAGTRVGRLPWKTLGLPDLRDASGERLWYAVSRCFIERDDDSYCSYRVNSASQGQIDVTGTAAAGGVVAVIFAPGAALAGQDRSAANVNLASAYLEGDNVPPVGVPCEIIDPTPDPVTLKLPCTDRFEVRPPCLAVDCPGGQFNDELIVVTREELFDAVENVVARRLENEIKPVLAAEAAKWGGYLPFPAPFVDPTVTYPSPPALVFDPRRPQAHYRGRASPGADVDGQRPGQVGGLLPVTSAAGFVFWGGAPAISVAAGTATLAGVSCSLEDLLPPASPPNPAGDGVPDRILCEVEFDAPDTSMSRLRIDTVLRNGARAFVDPARTNVSGSQTVWQALLGEVVFPDSASTTCPASPAPRSMTANGDGAVSYCLEFARSGAAAGSRRFVVRVDVPGYLAALTSETGSAAWFVKNEWYRIVYYAVAPGSLPSSPDGNPGCEPVPATIVRNSCLRLDGPTGTVTASAEALLVLAGRKLPGSAPDVTGWSVPGLFEYANANAPQTFDTATNDLLPSSPPGVPSVAYRQDRRAPGFNDRVVLVKP